MADITVLAVCCSRISAAAIAVTLREKSPENKCF